MGDLPERRGAADGAGENASSSPKPAPAAAGAAALRARGREAVGGALMGLANLVPGISGGTMLVAAGVYPSFVQAVSDATRLRFTRAAIMTLGIIAGAAVLAIALGAGPIVWAVANHRWVMYSLFIGLTLGGLPALRRLTGTMTPATWAGVAAGLLAMVGIAIAERSGATGAGGNGPVTLAIAGAAGASAMILPGVSGAYLLLLLGQYVPILESVRRAKEAVLTSSPDVGAAVAEWRTLLPVAIGVGLGVAVISNLIRLLLERFPRPTLGALMGLLVGAVVGLWPFAQPIPPAPGDVFKGVVMTEESIATLKIHDIPVRWTAPPSPAHAAGALALIATGFAATMLVSRLGRPGEEWDGYKPEPEA
jgi:putative membrane protein